MPKIIDKGAEARLLGSTFLGVDVVIKDRVRKNYRIEEIDSSIRKERTRSEARIMCAASACGARVPLVLWVGSSVLVLTRIYGAMLNRLVEGGRVDGQDLFGIMSDAGRQLALLHRNGIVHGDYTTANIIVDRQRKAWIIDFGLGELTSSLESRAVDVLLMKRSVSAALYSCFLESYLSSRGYDDAGKVVARLADIERRGRYQKRTLG